jgi:hypothetical protein
MKATLLKALFLAGFFISLTGCSKDESVSGKSSSSSSLSGSYHLVSMTSNVSVDLNDDGILSTNLLLETDPGVFSPNKADLEIKPTVYNNELVQLMSFYLPHPTMSYTKPDKPEGVVDYTLKGIGYEYEFNSNTQQITINKDGELPGPVPDAGRLDTIVVNGTNKLEAVFTKNYYDFAIAHWRQLTITCEYTEI